MIKELTLETINNLPDDVIEELYIRMKVEKGLKDVEEGRTMSLEDFRKKLKI